MSVASLRERLRRVTHVGAIFGLVLSVSTAAIPSAVVAGPGQGGAQQVVLNPGGGELTNGSDGLKFIINMGTQGGVDNGDLYEANEGQDGVFYRGTYQYCCGAGGPMLNIGGTLYGQSGAAEYNDDEDFTSIVLGAHTGSAVVGDPVGSTGSASAIVTYTVEKNDLTYTMVRTVSYTYPNDYVTDTYAFTIPAGNTEAVRFYLGGDTAPGSDDTGYGIMLTQPVRSVISLNPSSEIMFGFREINGSRPFDGAYSHDYSESYDTISGGGDLGFDVETDEHDAGLGVQWNLGTSAGTRTYSLEQFVTPQGTNLSAGFDRTSVPQGMSAKLNLNIVNTILDEADDLDYTFALPSGLVIASGTQSNDCGGSLTATAGASTITMANATAPAAANCLTSIPVSASSTGAYTINASKATGLNNLTNNVGSSTLTVTAPLDPPDDLNGDGFLDEDQANVGTATSPVNGKSVALEADPACTVDSLDIDAESANIVKDPAYEYPAGLLNFTLDCGTPGYTTTVTQYYYGGLDAAHMTARKYNPTTHAYVTIPSSSIVSVEVYDNNVAKMVYEITDGGDLDMDGEVNGIIVDPAGLGQAIGAPSTGLGGTGLRL